MKYFRQIRPKLFRLSLILGVLSMSFLSFAQNKVVVTGTVVDQEGIPMPAVSVVVKGAGIGKITD